MEALELAAVIRETSFAIHKYLRNGFREKIYENALANRLRKRGFDVRQQLPVKVYDEDGTPLGDDVADLLVEGTMIVELKACKSWAEEHFAQVIGYLRGTQIEHGMLINFGAPRPQLKKLILTPEMWEPEIE